MKLEDAFPPTNGNSGSYSNRRTWSDTFIPVFKQILVPYVLQDATPEQDMRQASDIVLCVPNLAVACRVRERRIYDNPKYCWQFTIRSSLPSETPTELHKIAIGCADWMLYAFAKSNDWQDGFIRWFLINLDCWRAHMILNQDKLAIDRNIPNPDRTKFDAYDIRSFPPVPQLCVATSEPIPPLVSIVKNTNAKRGSEEQIDIPF